MEGFRSIGRSNGQIMAVNSLWACMDDELVRTENILIIILQTCIFEIRMCQRGVKPECRPPVKKV